MAKRDLAAADPLAGIAREAHEAWCRRMIEQGWSAGKRYDEKKKMHDALVPFDRLPQPVRGYLIETMRVEEMEATLADLVEHPRGPDRPLSIDEVRVGLPVTFVYGKRDKGVPPVGKIASWTTDRYGGLELVSVRWEDGEVMEYMAHEGSVRPVGARP